MPRQQKKKEKKINLEAHQIGRKREKRTEKVLRSGHVLEGGQVAAPHLEAEVADPRGQQGPHVHQGVAVQHRVHQLLPTGVLRQPLLPKSTLLFLGGF